MSKTPSAWRDRKCLECGEPYKAVQDRSLFCGKPCSNAYMNRRRDRGAMLYDLFMLMRYERGLARLQKVWGLMCRMSEAWREEDMAERAGRKSWITWNRLEAEGRLTRFKYLSRTFTRAGR